MTHHLRIAALLGTLGALVVPAVAQATTETVTSGGVTASFHYQKASSFGFRNLTLSISRGGTVLYHAPVDVKTGLAPCGTQCWPGNLAGGKSVHVLDLEHNGGRDVVLDLYTGGAHCCSYEQVFYPKGSTYAVATRFFGDPGANIKDLRHNGRLEFLSANDAFAFRFTSFAASGLPIQIFTFGHGRFHDVTRSFPGRIAKDAKIWLNAFKHHFDDGEGVIAAWAADEYMLGRKKQANAYLNAQAKAGHLNALGSSLKGHKFVVALQKFLRNQGY